ncbi:MAG: DUF255 domain-containing protein [Phycisphaerales bacterium]|nr:DUF255 domain-containing protein [Phycisphaerales bacterium]
MSVQECTRCVAGLLIAIGLLSVQAMSDDLQPSEHPPNRLIHETSPYLLQHARNPVDWYPWGEEAFEAARREDKPIFLSIGYSTCYWCHVMERQSFESPEVAAMLNADFIPVKVDREERPDVDDIYMTAVQLMTRHGGWPLSVWLDPDSLMPFFGGTYFPPEDQGGRPGFMTLLNGLNEAWLQKRPELVEQAFRVGQAVRRQLAEVSDRVSLDSGVVEAAVAQLMASYDANDGGYGDAPKFPMPVHLNLLMEAAWDRPDVAESLKHTLDRMAMGGMYDQVGGGFHRYSTDSIWLVPHFEKMLYDNGMLASIYARSYEFTGDGFHGAIVQETLDYVLREMVDQGGAFWSAQDAESNAREGESYLWTPEEIREVVRSSGMSEEWADFANQTYGLDQGTNFRDPHHPHAAASNVLFLPSHPKVLADAAGLTVEEFHDRMTQINSALLDRRDLRDQPTTDDKILVGWNGLMIGGMADGGRILSEPRYVDAARRAADWIQSNMWSAEGGLLRTARGERVSEIPGFLEDYAMLIQGLLRLYEATEESQYLMWSQELAGQARERFYDQGNGWYDAPAGDESLFVRGRSFYDGALPSGTSVMLDNYRRLSELTGDPVWLVRAEETLAPMAHAVNRSPRGTAQATAAIHHLRDLDSARFGGGLPAEEGPVEAAIERSASDGGIELVLRIQDTWHVALSASDGVIPVSVQSSIPGVEVHADWPQGVPYSGPVGSMQVLSGVVRVPLQLSGSTNGPISIAVNWQACNDRICLRPVTRMLTISTGEGN